MAQPSQPRLKLYHGPNLQVPYPALLAQIGPIPDNPLPASRIGNLLDVFLPGVLRARIDLAPGDLAYQDLVLLLLEAVQGLPCVLCRSNDGAVAIATGFHEASATAAAVVLVLEITDALFAHAADHPAELKSLGQSFHQKLARLGTRQPDASMLALLREAQRRNIPCYPVAAGSRTWRYGQGCNGWHYFETSNQLDSITGARISVNKVWSNRLIRQLGFPGVEHAVAENLEAARSIARHLGYPVVVKPYSGSKGKGISANVRDQ